MKSLRFPVLFLILLAAFSCKRNNEPTVVTKTQLIARNWQIQTLTISLGTTTQIPAYTWGGSQNLIDLNAYPLNFKADGTYAQTYRDNTVDPNYTWKFLTNETGFSIIAQPSQYTVRRYTDC